MELFSLPLAVQFCTTSFNVSIDPDEHASYTSYRSHIMSPGNFARSPYYQQSIVALRQHQVACRLLGEPLRFQTLRLGNQQNWVTTEEAHVCCRSTEMLYE